MVMKNLECIDAFLLLKHFSFVNFLLMLWKNEVVVVLFETLCKVFDFILHIFHGM